MPTRVAYMSKETLASLIEQKHTAIKRNAKKFGIEESLIKAIIKKESDNYAYAYRVDYSVLKKQSWYKNTLTKGERKKKEYYASFGLMQVLYGNAKHNGYTGSPEGLFNPLVNIEYGCIIFM